MDHLKDIDSYNRGRSGLGPDPDRGIDIYFEKGLADSNCNQRVQSQTASGRGISPLGIFILILFLLRFLYGHIQSWL